MTFQRNHLAILGLGALATLGATACEATLTFGEEGSGVAETVTYDLADFDEIDVSGVFDVEVTVEDGPTSVEVTVDDNFVDDLDVRVDGRRLEIGWRRGSRDLRVSPTAVVTVPDLRALDVSGASQVSVDGIDTAGFALDTSGASRADLSGTIEQLIIDGSGASEIVIDGSAGELDLDLSGAASADLTGADIGSVELDLSGGSHAEFDQLDRADGQLSGGSAIATSPGTDLSVDTSGASHIDRD